MVKSELGQSTSKTLQLFQTYFREKGKRIKFTPLLYYIVQLYPPLYYLANTRFNTRTPKLTVSSNLAKITQLNPRPTAHQTHIKSQQKQKSETNQSQNWTNSPRIGARH